MIYQIKACDVTSPSSLLSLDKDSILCLWQVIGNFVKQDQIIKILRKCVIKTRDIYWFSKSFIKSLFFAFREPKKKFSRRAFHWLSETGLTFSRWYHCSRLRTLLKFSYLKYAFHSMFVRCDDTGNVFSRRGMEIWTWDLF